MWLLFLTIFVLYYFIQSYINKYYYWQRKGVTTDIKPWPIIGSVYLNIVGMKSFPDLLQTYYNKNPKDKVVGLHMFNNPVLIIKDLDLIKQVTVKEFDSFTDHEVSLNEEFDDFFGKGLFALTGQRWRDIRNTLSPAFTASKMRTMVAFMKESADHMVENYAEDLNNRNDYVKLETKDAFTRYTNDIIASVAFGIQCNSFNERENDFFRAGKMATQFNLRENIIMSLYVLIPRVMKFTGLSLIDKKIKNFFRNTIVNNLRIREEQGVTRNDLLNLLMQARKGQLKSEEVSVDTSFATAQEVNPAERTNCIKLTDEDIVAQAFAFYVSGCEVSSTAMSFMAYELAVNEEIQKKLQREIDENLANSNGKLDYDIITSMKYLDMVVSETLRKWPPASFMDRACTNPVAISVNENKSVILEKQDSVWIPVYCIHRDPKYYSDPDRFDPERFSNENKSKILPYAYMPFGLGPRNCIGSRFALLEVKVLFITLLSNYDIITTEKTDIPLKISKSGFILMSESGYWMGLRHRKYKL